MTIAQAYFGFQKSLKAIYDDREADNITDWVFEHATSLKKWERRANQHNELIGIHSDQLKEYLEELLQHKPVQYVLNEAWFYKMKFFVNEDVLIPRPETEELVEWIIDDVRCTMYDVGCENSNLQMIDIGTGSGCIPISLKRELINANVTAVDVSGKALMVAKENAAKLNAEINFLQIDFLKEKEWIALPQYNIIVSNPPYIPMREKEILAKNVTDFEPGIALFVADNNPLVFYEKMAKFAQLHLKENGKIYVEVHEEYANNVKAIFGKMGFISTIKKDIYGKERMVNAIKPAI